MTANFNKQEAECQTILQCSPHILRREEEAVVQSDGICQTQLSYAPENSNTNLIPLLSYTASEEIYKDAIKTFYLPRKPRLHFVLPDESGEFSDLEIGSNISTQAELLEMTTDNDTNPLEEQEEGEHPTTMNDVVEPVTVQRTSRELSQDSIKLYSILKNSSIEVNNTRRRKRKKTKTEDAACQTNLMVAPHILTPFENAVVTSNLSVQTSVTCHPECSVSDIIPKLKSYLVHEGAQAAPTSGDNRDNASVLDLIKELLDEVEISHCHLFDSSYKPPEIPAQLAIFDINHEKVNYIVPTRNNYIDSSKGNDIELSNENYIDLPKESETDSSKGNDINSSKENDVDSLKENASLKENDIALSNEIELNESENLKSVENEPAYDKLEMLERVQIDLEQVDIHQLILDIIDRVNLLPEDADFVKLEENIAYVAARETSDIDFVRIVEEIACVIKVEPGDSKFVPLIEEIADAVHLVRPDIDFVNLVEEIVEALKLDQDDFSGTKLEPKYSEEHKMVKVEINGSNTDFGAIKSETEDNVDCTDCVNDAPEYLDEWKLNNVIDTMDLTPDETVSSVNNEMRQIVTTLVKLATKVSKPQITDERQQIDVTPTVLDTSSAAVAHSFSVNLLINNFVGQQSNLKHCLFSTNVQLSMGNSYLPQITQLPKELDNVTSSKQNEKSKNTTIVTKKFNFQNTNQSGPSGICSSIIDNDQYILCPYAKPSNASHQGYLKKSNSLQKICKYNPDVLQTKNDNSKCSVNIPKMKQGKVTFPPCPYSINILNDVDNDVKSELNLKSTSPEKCTGPCKMEGKSASKNNIDIKTDPALPSKLFFTSLNTIPKEELNSNQFENTQVLKTDLPSDVDTRSNINQYTLKNELKTESNVEPLQEMENKELPKLQDNSEFFWNQFENTGILKTDVPSDEDPLPNINQYALKNELKIETNAEPVREIQNKQEPTSKDNLKPFWNQLENTQVCKTDLPSDVDMRPNINQYALKNELKTETNRTSEEFFQNDRIDNKPCAKQVLLKEKGNLSCICRSDNSPGKIQLSTSTDNMEISVPKPIEKILSSKSLACVCRSGHVYPIRVHRKINLLRTSADSYQTTSSIQYSDSDTVVDILLPRSQQFMSTTMFVDPGKPSSSQVKVKMDLKSIKKEKVVGNVYIPNESNCKTQILLKRPKSAPMLICKCKLSASKVLAESNSQLIHLREEPTKLESKPVPTNNFNLLPINPQHSYKMTMDHSISSSIVSKPDPVFLAMATCQNEFKPIKQALHQMQQKLKGINMPELDCILKTETAFKKKLDSLETPIMKYRMPTSCKQNQTESGTNSNSESICNQYKSFTIHSTTSVSPETKYSSISYKFTPEIPQNYANQISCTFQNKYLYSPLQSSFRNNYQRTFPIPEQTTSSKPPRIYEKYARNQNVHSKLKHVCPCNDHKDRNNMSYFDRKSENRTRNQNDRDKVQGAYYNDYDGYRAGPSKHFHKHDQPYYNYPHSYHYHDDAGIRNHRSHIASNSKEQYCCRKLKKTCSKIRSNKKRPTNTSPVKSSESQCPCLEIMKSLFMSGKSQNKKCSGLSHKDIDNLRVHLQFRTKRKHNV